MEKVLVLLSAYNGSRFIGEQLDSLIAQEGVETHVLVRDDGSTDDTADIVSARSRNDKRITLLKGHRLGFAMSFMELVSEAYAHIGEYDYFAFCDQDDYWFPRKLLAATTKIREKGTGVKPTLYWSAYTLADEQLTPLWRRPDEENTDDSSTNPAYTPVMTKPAILVRYFMLGCTMVFDRNMVQFIHDHKPKGNVTMHDLWLSQTAIFFGQVIYDPRSFILYRQHGNNVAGVDLSWKGRWRRFKKSLSTYERRHFREVNAKLLMDTYRDIMPEEDRKLVESVAHYRDSLAARMHLLRNRNISMGSFTSDLFIKARIILGLL